MNLLGNLVRRGLKLYLSDKMAVFLSLLSPIIIIFLYLMFLGNIQYDSVMAALDGLKVGDDAVHAFIDGWMLAGALGTSCVTVSFCAQYIMIADRESGALGDMLTSPIDRRLLSVSYLIVNFVITLVIVGIVCALSLVYIAIAGWYMSAADVGKLIGILLISVLCSSLFTTVVCMFIRTQSAHGGASGILSAAIGFFIGAYMPVSVFPKAIQYFVALIPSSYSAGILRNIFMRGALEGVVRDIPAAAAETVRQNLMQNFSMQMDAFGNTVGEGKMWMILGIGIAIFAVVYVVNYAVRQKTGTLFACASLPQRKKKSLPSEQN